MDATAARAAAPSTTSSRGATSAAPARRATRPACPWAASSNAPSNVTRREHWRAPRAGDVPCPVEAEYFPPLPVGDTPLWAPTRLRAELGFPGLWLKDDTCEPSGSYKDRASFLVAAFARKHRIAEVALASTGNAASSMACVGRGGRAQGDRLPSEVGARRQADPGPPVRRRAPRDRRQLRPGLRRLPRVHRQDRRPVAQYRLQSRSPSRARRRPPSRSSAISSGAGSRAPDHVFVPTGDGVILAGVIPRLRGPPRLGRDREDAEALGGPGRGLERDRPRPRGGRLRYGRLRVPPLEHDRGLDSGRRAAQRHLRPREAARARRRGIVVSDEEILEAQTLASSRAGLFAEPSSACALAGFMKARLPSGRARSP